MTAQREATYGLVIGVVIDVEDPSGEGQIRLKFPWLSEEMESGWAPIARPMAGGDRGFYFMPEVDDEVLVGFLHGNVNHPYVVGFLHNGVDLPPDQGIDREVRRLKTVSGHILEFDDRAGKERVLLVTNAGHRLEMKDVEGTVELKTAGGQQILMSDKPTGKIEIKTDGQTSVTLDDAQQKVEVKTPGGVSIMASDLSGVTVQAPTSNVSVTCLGATLTASSSCSITAASVSVSAASVSVNAAMATFSGVLQCTTLIATSVVSASYTPGAGNIW